MIRLRTFLAALFSASACLAAASPAHSEPHAMSGALATIAEWAQGARPFAGLGNFHRQASTKSAAAQEYFDQGMRFLWAFNHDESTRSFARATQLDPQCAICYWGVSLTVGPNYNLPKMAEPRAKVAWEALERAQEHQAQASPVERALITALAQRYQGPQALDPAGAAPVLTAYAEAMKGVARQFPEDLDVQVLFAEAMMNVNAWKLWSLDGTAAPRTDEIVATLEAVLAKDLQHPGANHYYIHAMEASPHPNKALGAALRLATLMPAAGHMRHMPAHIFERVGQYAAASAANRDGVAADLAYYALTRPPDYYAMYTAHNYQFLALSAAMEGRRAEAIDAARKSKKLLPDAVLASMPGADWYVGELYTAMVRFGMWDDILKEPAPDKKLTGLFGGYLYAQATALAAKNRVAEAKARLAEVEKLTEALDAAAPAGLNAAKDVFLLAISVAKARIAIAQNDRDEAIGLLREAVGKEDRLAYDEPADWFVPVRHVLGAVLLDAGKPQEAEAVYREDLARHPANGWALFGLARALAAQKRSTEATTAQNQFATAWKRADITLRASAF